ncbi:MAG: chemotaxis protein CheD [Rhizomicrobium sp.]|jgi:chemotaxis protein CheD
MSVNTAAHGRTIFSSRRLHLLQGEFRVSAEADIVLTTTLGSCVATCMRDPVARIGGMNHFLLPHRQELAGSDAVRYGAYAMEVLINDLLRAGCNHHRLEAKLFGGARLHDGLPDIGEQNVAFAEHFLRHEGITLLNGSVRGEHARRIQFWPVSGRVRQLALSGNETAIFESEILKGSTSKAGSVELFEL